MNFADSQLFFGIEPEQAERMLPCLEAASRDFPAGKLMYSYLSGQSSAAVILEGSASVVRYEANGSRTILESLSAGGIFGADLDFYTESLGSVHVVCDTPCRVLFLNYEKMIRPCRSACPRHLDLVQNILSILSGKSRLLGERVEVLSQRSIRDKLMCYFGQLSVKSGSHTFTLPFSMMDLADFLSVNRSAMVRELRFMREDGLIAMKKREVTLL